MSDDPAGRARELRERIRDANHRYFVLDAPELTDAEYDALVRELREIEERHPEARVPDSPTTSVGAEPAGELRTLRHGVPMFSLDNAFEDEDLDAFEARVQRTLGSEAERVYLAELKIDGLSVNVRYEDGALAWAATRGNGREGEEITANVRSIDGLPARVDGAPAELEVRGEIYLPKE
jgi:DNA ligase (NAD+)